MNSNLETAIEEFYGQKHLYEVLSRGQEVVGLIEDAMAEACSYEYANEDIEEQRLKFLIRILMLLVEPLHEEESESESCEPAQSIPSHPIAAYVSLLLFWVAH